MAGGGRRGRGRPSNSSSKGNNNSNNGRYKGGRRKGSSSGTRGALFVEGGLLFDWSFTSTPFRGKNPSVNNKSGSKSGSFDRTKASVSVKNGSLKSSGNAFGYQYPSVDVQEVLHSESLVLNSNDDNGLDKSDPFLLVDSKEAPIFAYMDKTPSSRTNDVQFTYDYGSDFVLGETSHRGLGFSDELEGTPSVVETSSREVEVQEASYSDSLSSGHEMNEERMNNELDVDMHEKVLEGKSYPKTNSGFLHIGGLKLYTQDISEDEDSESVDEGSLESSEPDGKAGFSESEYSEETSDSGSDIDEEVAEDYFEGIGGSDNIVNINLFEEQEFNESTDDTSSSSDYDETVKKLGGIALQEASKEYGMMKTHTKHKRPDRNTSLAVDDLFLVKDPRTASRRKKNISRLPQSLPSETWRSATSKRFPGLKKKRRKEMIAVKRRERMLRRGVDLEEVNVKLEQIVMDGTDIYSFQPMHSRDCSQVRRLAAIYRLQSGCQGSGKKRIVTVTRTQHTCMPSSSDRICLKKLIGDGMQDADFPVVDVSNIKSVSGDKKRSKKFAQGRDLSPLEQHARRVTKKNSANCHGSTRSGEYKQKGKREPYANQPVSFVSSGTMQSQNVETTAQVLVEIESSSKNKSGAASENFGTFELHTKGFGSKMMAKMGFEGGGLGKDGQGMATPIEVIKRPKSLGLGMEFSNDVDIPVKSTPTKTKSQRIGAFENHTKGFGSKMMAKMGFVEGMGLGKNSQGMVNPLVAVKRPKARGLGAQV